MVGDAVNVAARLEQLAPPGEILLGAETYRLVRDAVKVEEVEPLTAKGKSQPVRAFRLLEVTAQAPGVARRLDSPLVGRDRELAVLEAAFERALQNSGCEVVTVLGPAGVGKSRLAHELGVRVADRATMLQGRCLSYGEGITFWPLAEVVRQAAGIDEADSAEEAQARIAGLLPGDAEGRGIARSIGVALGLSAAASTPDETFWAARKLFECLAQDSPLVVVFDDLHWAEPTFLDLLEYLKDYSRGRPVLLLYMARPELREARPALAPADDQNTVVLTAARPGRERASDRAPAGRGTPCEGRRRAHHHGRRGQPAVRGGVAPDAGGRRPAPTARWALERDRRPLGAVDPAHDPGAPRSAARPPRLRRAWRDRARLGGGPGVLARCGRGAGARAPAAGGGSESPGAHRQGSDQSRRCRLRRRGRVPVLAHPHPRRRLRRPLEGSACRPSRALRRLARAARPAIG